MTPPNADFAARLFRLWAFITTTSYAFATFVFLSLLAGAALAQDGGVADAVPALADDPLKALAGTAEAVSTGNWWAVSAGIVSFATWAFRSGVLLKLPKTGFLSFLGRAGTWLAENPIASWVTPFALSAALAALTTLANGTPFTVAMLMQEVLKIGAGAIAVFIGVEKVKEAKNAGKLRAAGITTQQEAVDELTKRLLKGPPAP